MTPSTMKDRKIVWLDISPDDILHLLRTAGMTTIEVRGKAVQIPDDSKLVSVTLRDGGMLGDARLALALESDALPEECRYRGYAINVIPTAAKAS
jgi:hypothetical protein